MAGEFSSAATITKPWKERGTRWKEMRHTACDIDFVLMKGMHQ